MLVALEWCCQHALHPHETELTKSDQAGITNTLCSLSHGLRGRTINFVEIDRRDVPDFKAGGSK
jgi:hypothetical protein